MYILRAAVASSSQAVNNPDLEPQPLTSSNLPKVSSYHDGGDWLASRHAMDQATPRDPRAELTTYLFEGLHPLNASGNTNILEWWKVCPIHKYKAYKLLLIYKSTGK